MSSDQTYPGGIKAVLSQYEGRRDAFDYAPGEALPDADIDLTPLSGEIVADPDLDPAEAAPFRSSYHRKRHALRKELTGLSELCYLNAMLISHLRKRSFPAHAPALFNRLWAEHGDHLRSHLDQRWQVSAITTFGDHGATAAQRSVGLALTALFGMMKLYESERLYSGHTPDRAFALDGKQRAVLPLDMDSYSLTGGGLDVNLIARLWQEAAGDTVIAPLAHGLIEDLTTDPRTVFKRLRTMKSRKERLQKDKVKPSNIAPVPHDRLHLDSETLRWGLVSTIKAPLPQIARFAAHHIEMGASLIQIYLDQPDHQAEEFLTRHPAIRITQCDDVYWQDTGKPRMAAHQQRQAHNATRSLRALEHSLDWLGHIDVDEFILSDGRLSDRLATVPPACALARIPPAEALASEDGTPCHFKLTHKQAGVPKAQLQDIYPTFGMHLYGGFLSHTSGKVFARTGIPDTRLGIHTLKYRGADATNRIKPDGLYLAHMHAPSWDHFRNHLEFRRSKGSYRARSERPELGQAELLGFLADEEGDEGLRAFFDEVCADTPELRKKLGQHKMLLRCELDLDAAVSRVFGTAP
ncbi:glycosyltransferase family 2 protein [Thalassococcus lentus]|uniref:Glycosyltransferase family 2 protein n=1 Tax=Thalassococcus lentus TaxID=1210524 RepID=A0ABT4XXE7_9RHOB|nr:glycosyltransferase family 2 protein [Thalassococcus lentus]MDA7426629.1 glycosyltransferase family 2 protein [Thalassococcus lentus]